MTTDIQSTPPTEDTAERRGCGSFGLGVALVIVGIPMLVCPGPGIASIAAGLAMMAASVKQTPDK